MGWFGWGIECDAQPDLDVPAGDADVFDEQAQQLLFLGVIEGVDDGVNAGGEVVHAGSELVVAGQGGAFRPPWRPYGCPLRPATRSPVLFSPLTTPPWTKPRIMVARLCGGVVGDRFVLVAQVAPRACALRAAGTTPNGHAAASRRLEGSRQDHPVTFSRVRGGYPSSESRRSEKCQFGDGC